LDPRASALNDFGLALFIGLMSGAYSSIFIASPILSLLKEREPRYVEIRRRLAAYPRRAKSSPGHGGGWSAPGLGPDGGDDDGHGSGPVAVVPVAPSRPTSRPVAVAPAIPLG